MEEITTDEELAIYLRQRVRLFVLSEDSSWCERGIGCISACYFEKCQAVLLAVTAESDGSPLLGSIVQKDTAYKKQEGRFIIWSEFGQIFGLSFQVMAGCDEIWEIICRVQGKDPCVEIATDIVIKEEIDVKQECSIEEEDIAQDTNVESTDHVAQEMWFEEMLDIEHKKLSTYDKDVLEQLIELVNRLVAPFLAAEDMVPTPAERRLLYLFHMNEDVEETEGLQQLRETLVYMLAFSRNRQ